MAQVLASMAPLQTRTYKPEAYGCQHSEAQAEVWIKARLAAVGLTANDLRELMGSAPSKLMLACLLWRSLNGVAGVACSKALRNEAP